MYRWLRFGLGVVMIAALIITMLWVLGGWKALVGVAVAIALAVWFTVGLLLMYYSVSRK